MAKKYTIHVTLWAVEEDGSFDLLEEEECKGCEDSYDSYDEAKLDFDKIAK